MRIGVVIPNYNSAATVVRAAGAMLDQVTGPDHTISVVIVDDGSTDRSVDELLTHLGSSVRLVPLVKNMGRSTARNEGARACDAELLIFIDSDCVAVGNNFIDHHVSAIESGAAASYGQVSTPGDGFWDRLQRDSNAARSRQFERKESWAFTTQNFAVTRAAFEATGGFDPVFDRHGFEDRDLFVRLELAGAHVVYTQDAQVVHEDRIGLASVARKMRDAGYHAAHLFRERHAEIYSRMAYSRLDCALHPRLSIVDALLWPIVQRVMNGPARWLEWRWAPFRLRMLVARAVYGLAFLHGTAVRIREQSAI